MRIRFTGKALVAGLTVGGLMAFSLPAQAHTGGSAAGTFSSRSGIDMADDTLDPFLAQNSPQHGLSPTTYHNNNADEVDIRSWSVERITLPGGPALKASWTVGANLPTPDVTVAPGVEPYPSFNGYSFDIFWQNKAVQTNFPAAVRNRQCLRAAPGDIGAADARNHDSNPNNNTYIYSPFAGHWKDSYWWQIGVSLSYSGAQYEVTPQLSRFYPGPDGGYSFWDLKTKKQFNANGTPTLANPYPGKGFYYDWTVSGTTITVSAVTAWIEQTGTCENIPGDGLPTAADDNWSATNPLSHFGPRRIELILPGETVSNVSSKSWLNQLVILPAGGVPLSSLEPLPVICDVILNCQNIEAIGGFIYSEDWSQQVIGASTVEDYDIGIFGPDQLNTDTLTQAGPFCWTPTFGGTLPVNPLWAANNNNGANGCGTDNPVGPEVKLNGNDFVF